MCKFNFIDIWYYNILSVFFELLFFHFCPVTITLPSPFGGHRSSTFLNLIDHYLTFLNVIDRSLTLPQRDPLFPTNISLNMSLVGHLVHVEVEKVPYMGVVINNVKKDHLWGWL